MILIYCPETTNRVEYVFKLIFQEMLGSDFKITSDLDQFVNSGFPKISYARQKAVQGLYFKAAGLLFETGVRNQDLKVFKHNGVTSFFEVENDSALPFDPFSAVFYLVSRYEEYLPHKQDFMGRYTPEQSLAFKHHFLSIPIVDIWVKQLAALIKNSFPALQFKQREFEVIDTIDIDNAFAYLEKGVWRNLGGYFKSALLFDMKSILNRSRVLWGLNPDPYDTYPYLSEQFAGRKKRPLCFVLLGDYGRFDKNVSWKSEKLQEVIKGLATHADIGIHPSVGSYRNTKQINIEIKRLASILKKKVCHSRQHYLKFSLPETYRNLIKSGITGEYSMGYSSVIGFRAGISTPFYFYDLELESETHLRIHPFAVMDRALKDHLHLTPDQAIDRLIELREQLKNVGGTLMTVWHNESLTNSGEWKGWRTVYECLHQ